MGFNNIKLHGWCRYSGVSLMLFCHLGLDFLNPLVPFEIFSNLKFFCFPRPGLAVPRICFLDWSDFFNVLLFLQPWPFICVLAPYFSCCQDCSTWKFCSLKYLWALSYFYSPLFTVLHSAIMVTTTVRVVCVRTTQMLWQVLGTLLWAMPWFSPWGKQGSGSKGHVCLLASVLSSQWVNERNEWMVFLH